MGALFVHKERDLTRHLIGHKSVVELALVLTVAIEDFLQVGHEVGPVQIDRGLGGLGLLGRGFSLGRDVFINRDQRAALVV